MNERRLLLEMPVMSEDEVFAQSSVASVSSERTAELEGEGLRTYVMNVIWQAPIPPNYVLTEREIGTIISHHCTGKLLRKAALQTIPQVLTANNIISPWKRKEGKGVKSGLVAAPININGVKYLCCVTLHMNAQKTISPYAITLKDANGNIVNEEKVTSAIKVPHSIGGNSTFGNTRLSKDTASLDANSPSDANIQQSDNNKIKESRNMKKNTIKLNEEQLRQVVAESVKGIIKEYTNPTTDGAIYPQNRESDIKRDAYRLIGAFKGDKKHRQSVTDAQKTNDKYRRYDAWSEKDGLNHGAPFYVPLLKAMNDAKKSLNDEFSAAIDRNPNTTDEEKDFIYDKWHQAMDGLEKSFYEIRNYYRERGVVSDYRGR